VTEWDSSIPGFVRCQNRSHVAERGRSMVSVVVVRKPKLSLVFGQIIRENA
jgi:hypothetical protein